jgi:hypothetical protein
MTPHFAPGVSFKKSVLDFNPCSEMPNDPYVVYKFYYKTIRGCYRVAVVDTNYIPAGFDFVLKTPINGSPVEETSPKILINRGWLYFNIPLNRYEVADIERIAVYGYMYKPLSEQKKECNSIDWLY